MPPKSRICRRRDVVAGMVGSPGSSTRATASCSRSICDDRARVRAVPLHADARASSRRAARGSSRTATAPRPSRSGGTAARRRTRRRRPRRSRRRRRSDRRGTSCCECTTASAPSASGCWRYGVAKVLSTTTRASRACASLRDGRDVDDRRAAGWSASRSRPSGSRRATRRRARRGRARSTAVHVDAEALVHARDEPERAAVRVGREDHVVAGIERAQDRVLGREAAREREPVPRAFERREARLERGARRVAAARVLVAPVLADRVLRERRREADRRDDRAGGGSGSWPAWIARVSKPSSRLDVLTSRCAGREERRARRSG